MASRELHDAEVLLAQAWVAINNIYRLQNPGATPQTPARTLIVTNTYRTPLEQKALYDQGRTKPGSIVTNIDGVTRLGNHNFYPARALDFAVLIGGNISWATADYMFMKELARLHGLAWGGNWTTLKDYPHIELPGLSPSSPVSVPRSSVPRSLAP
jgi:hypothetical protein